MEGTIINKGKELDLELQKAFWKLQNNINGVSLGMFDYQKSCELLGINSNNPFIRLNIQLKPW